MEEVIKILNLSRADYNKLVFKYWFHYCEYNSLKVVLNGTEDLDIADFQKLLANAVLFNYWFSQYRKYELEFVQEAQPYLSLEDHFSLIKLYEKNVWKVNYHYSKKLINNARKLNIKSPLYN